MVPGLKLSLLFLLLRAVSGQGCRSSSTSCPSGWTAPEGTDKRCYKYLGDDLTKSRKAAAQQCYDENSAARLPSMDERAEATTMWALNSGEKEVWIGLLKGEHKNSPYWFTDGTSAADLTDSNKVALSVDNGDDKKPCFWMKNSEVKNDDCTATKNVMCMLCRDWESQECASQSACPDGWQQAGSKCFKQPSENEYTYKDAVEACAQLDATMPSVTSDAERDAINAVSDSSNVWVALFDETKAHAAAYWQGGTASNPFDNSYVLNDLNFNKDEEYCVVFEASSGSKYRDEDCDTTSRVVCQKSLASFGCATAAITTSSSTTPAPTTSTSTSAEITTTSSTAEQTSTSTSAEITTTSSTAEQTTSSSTTPVPTTTSSTSAEATTTTPVPTTSSSTSAEATTTSSTAEQTTSSTTPTPTTSSSTTAYEITTTPDATAPLCEAGQYALAGKGCVDCPAFSHSPQGATNISMCECNAGFHEAETGFQASYYFFNDALQSMPDVSQRSPNATATSRLIFFENHADFASVVPSLPQAYYAITWSGLIHITIPGQYTFSTSSDDGSHLWVNDQMLVDNSGLHAVETVSGVVNLTTGFHAFFADFFENLGSEQMQVHYSGPDTDDQTVHLTAAARCSACPAGQYKSDPGPGPCANCPAGTFSTLNTSTSNSSCDSCPDQTYSMPGSDEATDCVCNAGYSGPDGEACSACNAGSFKAVNGSTSCSLCGSGTFSPSIAARSADTCIACPSHTSSVQGSTNVSGCICNPGFTGPDGEVCLACQAGTYKHTLGSNACTDCPPDTFSEKVGASQSSACSACPANMTSVQGSTECLCVGGYHPTQCESFAPGTHVETVVGASTWDVDGRSSRDLVQILNVIFPQNATEGMLAHSGGAAWGFWIGINGDGSAAKFRLRIGASNKELSTYPENTAYLELEHGSFPADGQAHNVTFLADTDPNEVRLWIDGECKGQHVASTASTYWHGPDAGTLLIESSNDIPVGEVNKPWPVNSPDTQLILSTAGAVGFTYVVKESCSACPAGTYKVVNGSSSCLPCASGTFSISTGATSDSVCGSCPQHAHSRPGSDEETDCICNAGYSGPDGQACSACKAGTFKALNGSSSCSLCESGTFSTSVASTSDSVCGSCPDHTHSMSGSNEVTDCICVAGYSGPDGEACSACPVGTYKNFNGSSSCSLCGSGTFSTSMASTSDSVCVSCPEHTHSGAGSDEAADCVCNAGYAGPDGEACLACTAGTYKALNGSSSCSFCASGTFSTSIAATSDLVCGSCPNHTHSVPGSNEVTDCTCLAGYSGPDGEACLACLAGTYKSINGSSSCSPCGSGTFSTTTASTSASSCGLCPDHTHSGPGSDEAVDCICVAGYTGPDGEACSACQAGTYKSVNGSSSCSLCGAGTFSTSMASISGSVCGSCPDHTNSPWGSDEAADCVCNAGYSGPDGDACSPCPAGSYKALNGSSGCLPCESGKYSTSVAATSPATCLACPDHSHSPEGSHDLVDCVCNAGFSGPDGEMCSACQAGTYKPTNGSSSCLLCGPGKYSHTQANASESACLTCPENSHSIIQRPEYQFVGWADWPMDCSVQTWAEMDEAMNRACHAAHGNSTIAVSESMWFSGQVKTEVVDLSSRTYFLLFTDSEISDACPSPGNVPACAASGGIARRCHRPTPSLLPSGCQESTPCYVSTTRLAMCAVLQAGSLSYPEGVPISDINMCTCNLGYTGADGTDCRACPAGSYKPINGSSLCTECLAGKYSTETGQAWSSTCQQCPAFTFSLEGSNQVTNCTCIQGFTGPDGLPCTSCGAGTFKEVNGSQACSLCQSGSYSTSTAAVSKSTCSSCPAHTHSPTGSDEITDCICNAGYSGADGEPCSGCSAGSFKPLNGSHACSLCQSGSYSTSTAAVSESTCSSCPAHAHSPTGSDEITDCICNAGYSGADGEPCTECGVGTFKSLNGSHACSLCPSGSYSTSTAAVSESTCSSCPANTQAPEGSDEITDCICRVGYTGGDGQTCQHCPVGMYKQTVGSLPCTLCTAGKYSESLGAHASDFCLSCSENSFSPTGSGSASNCTCNAGHSGEDGGTCTVCQPGSYKLLNGSSPCIECSSGHYSTSVAATSITSCERCPNNTVSSSGSGDITDCACLAGYTGPNGFECVACPAGKYKSAEGSDDCTACPPDTFSNVIAAESSTVCESCPVNSKSPAGSITATNCSCPQGYTGGDGQDCSACSFGKFKDLSGPSECEDCPAGTYGPLQGSKDIGECNACSPGSDSVPGSSIAESCICNSGYTLMVDGQCSACQAGTFKAVNGSSECITCPTNTYGASSAAIGSHMCLNCPPFTMSLPGTSHKDNCTCIPGYGIGELGQCEACTVGSYKNLSGNAACTPCEPGTISEVEGSSMCTVCPVGTTSGSGTSECQLIPPVTTNSTPAPPAQLIVNTTNNTVIEQVQALGQTVATAAAVSVATSVATSVAASVATSVGASVGAAASGSVASSSAASAGSSGSTMTVINQVQFLAILGGASGGESETASSYSDSFGWAMMDTPVDVNVGGSGSENSAADAAAGSTRRSQIVSRLRRSGLLYYLMGRRKKTTSGLGQEAEDFTFEGQCDDVGSVLLEKLSAAAVLVFIVFLFRNLIWFFILFYTGQHSHELVFPAWEGPVAIFEFFPVAEIAAATFGQFCTGWSIISVALFVLGPGTLLVLSYYLVSKYMKKGKLNFEYHRSFDQRLQEIEHEEKTKKEAGKKRSGIRAWFHRLHVRYLKFTNGGGWDITHKEARFWAFTFGDFRDTVFLFFAWQLLMKLLVSISMHVMKGGPSAVCLCLLYFSDMIVYFYTWPFIDGLNNVGSAICGVTNFFSVTALSLPRLFPSIDWSSIIPEFVTVMIATLGMFATLVISTVKPAFSAASAFARLPCWGAIFGFLGAHSFLAAAAHAGKEGGTQFMVGLAMEEAEDKVHEKAHGRGLGEDDWEDEEKKALQTGDDDFDLMNEVPTAAVLVRGPYYIPRNPKHHAYNVSAHLGYLGSGDSSSSASADEPMSKVHQLPNNMGFQKVSVSKEQRATPVFSARSASLTSGPSVISTMNAQAPVKDAETAQLVTLFYSPPPVDALSKMQQDIAEATKHTQERKRKTLMEPNTNSDLNQPSEAQVRLNVTAPAPVQIDRLRSVFARSASTLRAPSTVSRVTSAASTSSSMSSKKQKTKSLAKKMMSFRKKVPKVEEEQDPAMERAQSDSTIDMEVEREPKQILLDIVINALNDVDWVLRSDQVVIEAEDLDQFVVTFRDTEDIGPSSISATKLAESLVEQSQNKQSRLQKSMAGKFTLVSAEHLRQSLSWPGLDDASFSNSFNKKRRISDPEHHLARLTSGKGRVDRTGSLGDGGDQFYKIALRVEINAAGLTSFRSKRQAGLSSMPSVNEALNTNRSMESIASDNSEEGCVLCSAIRRALNDVEVITRSDQISIENSNPERCIVTIQDTKDTGPNAATAKELVNTFLDHCDNEASRFKKLLRGTQYRIESAEIIEQGRLDGQQDEPATFDEQATISAPFFNERLASLTVTTRIGSAQFATRESASIEPSPRLSARRGGSVTFSEHAEGLPQMPPDRAPSPEVGRAPPALMEEDHYATDGAVVAASSNPITHISHISLDKNGNFERDVPLQRTTSSLIGPRDVPLQRTTSSLIGPQTESLVRLSSSNASLIGVELGFMAGTDPQIANRALLPPSRAPSSECQIPTGASSTNSVEGISLVADSIHKAKFHQSFKSTMNAVRRTRSVLNSRPPSAESGPTQLDDFGY